METRSNSRKGMGLLILGAMLVCLFSGLANAQENWVYTRDEVNQNDAIDAVAVGPDGNIYITGYSKRHASYYRGIVISLTPAGDTNWVYTWLPYANGQNRGFDIVVGPDTNIYVAGMDYPSTSYDQSFYVLSLTRNGAYRWQQHYKGSNNKNEHANCITYGDDDRIYVGGYLFYNSYDERFTVMSFNKNTGSRYWNNSFNGQSGEYDDWCNDIVYGNDGYVYGAGQLRQSSGAYNMALVKYRTSDGNRRWIYSYKGITTNGEDEAYRMSKGWSGGTDIIMCGYAANSGTSASGRDFTVVSVDSSGTMNWDYNLDGNAQGEDIAYDIAAGPSNMTYVVGFSTDSLNSRDYTVLALSGWVKAWDYTHNGEKDSTDVAKRVTLNSSGSRIYTTGYVTGLTSGIDVYATKHQMSGATPLWTYEYDGTGASGNGKRDVGNAIATTTGDIYIGGYSGVSGTTCDIMAISLSENFPPTIPVLISPADSAWLNDTTGITTRWHKSTDLETSVSGYFLSRSLDPNFTTCDTVVRTDTLYTATYNDLIWYWRVKAYDTQGKFSHWSAPWSFGFDLTAPNTPTQIGPADGGYVLDLDVDFEWGPVTFETPTLIHYVLQVDMDDQFPAPIVDDTLTATTTTKTMPGETTYYWRIKAFDLAGNQSNWSGANTYMVDVTAPLIDSTTQLLNSPPGSPGPFNVYTWVYDMFGLDSVVLWFQRQEDPGWITVDMEDLVPGDWWLEQIYAVSLSPDTVKYKIYAEDNAGYSTWDPVSDYYTFIAQDPGIQELDTPTIFSFGLKNNPARTQAMFSMSLPEDALINLRIYDITGRLVDNLISGTKSAGNYNISWTPKVSSGIFFYRLDSPWQQKIGKLVLLK